MLGTGFIEHEERRHAGTDRHSEIGCRDLFQIELDHHVLGDLPAFGSAILQALKPVLHFSDAALEPCCQGLIGECCADDGPDDFMEICQALDRIGKRLLVDLGIVSPDAVPNDLIAYGGEGEINCKTLVLVR